MGDVLAVEGLRKAYGTRQAVDGVSLSVAAGEVLALLGPNGAGKSTTVGMLCGLIDADAGRISVAGLSLASNTQACKRRIGLVPQDLALFDGLPARDNVELSMEEAQRLADHLVIIDGKRVVARGTLDELLQRLETSGPVQRVERQGDRYTVAVQNLTRDAAAVLQVVQDLALPG